MNEGDGPQARDNRSFLRRPRTLAAALVLAMAYFIAFYLWVSSAEAGGPHNAPLFLTFGFLIGGPAAAAALAVCISDPKGQASGLDHAALGISVGMLILGGGILFFGEGGVCTVMAAPLFLPCALIAAIWTGKLLRRRGGRLSASILPFLPLLVLQAEADVERPTRTETVVDSVLIDAPPADVWAELIEVRNIRPDELGWTFTQNIAGVPKPLDARLDRTGVGAVRQVTWGGGIRFVEEITLWEHRRHLAWRFRFAPGSIPTDVEQHVRLDAGYLSVDSGSYTLEPLPHGRTRLTLTTRYRLATGINGYSAWWGRIMIGDFHRNVLRVISGRARKTA